MSRRAPLVAAESRKSLSHNVRMALSYGALLVFTIFALYPISRVVTIAIRPGDQLLSSSLALIPRDATFANFRILLFQTPFLRWLGNSTLIALAVTITGVALASTAGYALSRFRFLGRSTTMNGLLVTQMFPATMLLLPLYLILIKLGLINSYLGVIVIYTATALPFCIWQLKGYYDTIPLSLEEACSIDGATRWQAFYLVVLPLAAPAVVITALFSFLTAWNEYVVAALILQDVDLFTLPLGLKMFQSNMSTQWGLYAAGALLVSLPVIALFLVLSRFLVSGLSSGAVKG
ncbi:MAG TPA: ABC transporter permease subunit [Chthoniobacterales bacterium]|jgi:arabinogalactan oligomer/maltooligosaccharide transport system permease protein